MELTDYQLKREEHFQKSLDEFCEQKLESLVKQFTEEYGLDPIEVEVFENAPAFINKCYWRIVNETVRPIISSTKPDKDSDRIDIYKILSIKEYSIINQKPFIVKKIINGNEVEIDYNSVEDLYYKVVENLITSTFAFECSLNFLKGWDGDYKVIFNNEKITSQLFDYVETEDVRGDSMTIRDEHIAIIAFTNDAANYPIFTNATWWRLTCLFLYKLNEFEANSKKID